MDTYKREMLQLLDQCADTLIQAAVWFWVGGTSADDSHWSAALERSIVLARISQSPSDTTPRFGSVSDRDFQLASGLQQYTANLIDQGEIIQAEPLAQEGLDLFQMRQNHYGIGDCLGSLGLVALLQGDLREAQARFQEVITIALNFHFPVMLCEWQPLLAIVTLYGGDSVKARQLVTESLRLCMERKEKNYLSRNYIYQAEVALWEGELQESEQQLRQSLSHRVDPHRITIYEVMQLWVAARLATAQQQYQRAATLFGVADQVHSQIHYAIAGSIRSLADTALARVREALEPVLFAETFAVGQGMSLVEAFATILAPAHGLPQGLDGNITAIP